MHWGQVMRCIRLTAQQINPRADAHLLTGLHHFQGLVEKNLASQRVVDDLDDAVCQGKSPSRGVFLHADPPTEGKFEDDAAAEGVGDIVVPEGKVALLTMRLS